MLGLSDGKEWECQVPAPHHTPDPAWMLVGKCPSQIFIHKLDSARLPLLLSSPTYIEPYRIFTNSPTK